MADITNSNHAPHSQGNIPLCTPRNNMGKPLPHTPSCFFVQ